MRIYINKLAYATTEDGLRNAFEAHGTVTRCSIPLDQRTGIFKGFGYIVMQQEEEATRAIAALNATRLDGRIIEVRESRQPKNKPAAQPRITLGEPNARPKTRRRVT